MDSTPEQPFAEELPEPATIQLSPSAQNPTPEQPFAEELPEPATIQLSPSAQDPFAQEPRSTAHRVFFGPFGLRAGWSLLIYLAIAACIILGVHSLSAHGKARRDHAAATAAKVTGATNPSPPIKSAAITIAPRLDASKPAPMLPMIIVEAIILTILVLLSWLMAAIEHRRISAFGLGGIQSIRRFLVGAVCGLAAMALLIASLRGFHLLAFDTRLDHGRSILGWGATQLFAFLLVGLVEEYTFRGYLQFTLTRGMVCIGNLVSPQHARAIAFWIASILTSALFLYAHTRNPGETWFGLFSVFLAGLLFVIALWRTGSLWWAIGFHMAWDWSQSFLYGVPDSGTLIQGRLFATHALGKPLYSGGTDGPEGSLLCAPIILLVILILLYTHPSPQPPLETSSDPFPQEPSPGLSIAS